MFAWLTTSRRLFGFVLVGLLGLSLPGHAQEHLQGLDLVTALRHGGYVLYVRHAATSRERIDQDPIDYHDRRTQRNLSAQGYSQAQTLGTAMRMLDIPVAPTILTSPYCRCIETAYLAFGRGTISHKLAFAIKMDEAETRQRGEYLKHILATVPPVGTNVVLVAHTANLKEAANVWPKPEGVTMIFKPSGQGDFTLVGRVEVPQWEKAGGTIWAERSGSKDNPTHASGGVTTGRHAGAVHEGHLLHITQRPRDSLTLRESSRTRHVTQEYDLSSAPISGAGSASPPQTYS